jgi:dolichyl-diphosphooligosaccharide--protein glycosyltransferase
MSWHAVLGNEYVSFVESDAWYHMRLVDALVRDFPNRIWHDPYLLHPGGETVNAGPMFGWIVAGIALVLGGGAPSPRLVDLVGAFVPPLLGALTLLPVYAIGRQLWSPRAGMLAAALVAGMPGQLLMRSTLGFADHHCLEALLTALTMMLVVMSLGERRGRGERRWLALTAGLALGAYCLTWGGAVWLMGVLGLWAGLQALAEWLHGRTPTDVLEVVALVAGVAGVVVLPWAATRPQFAYQAMTAGAILAALAGVAITAAAAARFEWTRRVVVLSAALVAVLGCVVVVWVARDQAASLLADAMRMSPFRERGFVYEAQPLMASNLWRPVPLWKELAGGALVFPAALGVAAADVWRRRDRGTALTLLWSATSLLATFGQIRFAMYLGLNVALLVAWLWDRVLGFVAVRGERVAWASTIVVCVALLAPGVPEIRSRIKRISPLEAGWHDALLWASSNTPAPFERPDVYYRPGSPGVDRSSYGVFAWWDHGYWITRIARRVPVTNPRQTNVADAAAFLMSTDEAAANEAIRRLGARYVISSWDLQVRSPYTGTYGFFNGIANAAGRNSRDYCGLYVRAGETAVPSSAALYCYPSYFQTTAVRLHLYGGRAAAPAGAVTVLASRTRVGAGVPINVIEGEWSFPTYDAAATFVRASARKDLRIVSRDLRETCVPLEAFPSYVSVFRSQVREGGLSAPPTVQVFEFRDPALDRETLSPVH